MPNLFVKSALAALVGIASFAATIPSASAAGAGIEARIETVGYRNGFHGANDPAWHRDGYRSERRDRDGRHYRERDRRHGNWGRHGRCAPWQAVEKARSHGLRHARIAHVTPRRVVVEGMRFQRPMSMTFANARHCPVLWR